AFRYLDDVAVTVGRDIRTEQTQQLIRDFQG
ncbi:MAG: hypothetical protein ACI9HI_001437, partial [Salinirussus sp.]